jgi:hypothetical protein
MIFLEQSDGILRFGTGHWGHSLCFRVETNCGRRMFLRPFVTKRRVRRGS